MSEALTIPACPSCGAPMQLHAVIPAAFGHPELCSFACTECRNAVTIEQPPVAQKAAPVEPVSSVAQAAWPTARRAF